ncbi:MAG: hypothetical protein IIA55_09960 [Gemmatimonadetes bacterium]|nr:hypothetical protein [Gemmatimonadota bacterium]
MRVRISSLVVWSLLVCVLFAGGCLDALGEGLTEGLRDGLASIVEDFIAESIGG